MMCVLNGVAEGARQRAGPPPPEVGLHQPRGATNEVQHLSLSLLPFPSSIRRAPIPPAPPLPPGSQGKANQWPWAAPPPLSQCCRDLSSVSFSPTPCLLKVLMSPSRNPAPPGPPRDGGRRAATLMGWGCVGRRAGEKSDIGRPYALAGREGGRGEMSHLSWGSPFSFV